MACLRSAGSYSLLSTGPWTGSRSARFGRPNEDSEQGSAMGSRPRLSPFFAPQARYFDRLAEWSSALSSPNSSLDLPENSSAGRKNPLLTSNAAGCINCQELLYFEVHSGPWYYSRQSGLSWWLSWYAPYWASLPWETSEMSDSSL